MAIFTEQQIEKLLSTGNFKRVNNKLYGQHPLFRILGLLSESECFKRLIRTSNVNVWINLAAENIEDAFKSFAKTTDFTCNCLELEDYVRVVLAD